MSKIGRTPISIPSGVTLTQADGEMRVVGPKGALVVAIPTGISFSQTPEEITVNRANDTRQSRANHGLIRSLLQNAIVGVSEGFTKTLKLVGTGYRAQSKGAGISLALGFSHPITQDAVPGIKFEVPDTETIIITGIDKQQVGQLAAELRSKRPPEPYKGKGIRYESEKVKRKQGKAAAA
ncbi:MAG: 50S ribosomal protein L6 [Candidatus Pacebacteria bacterium]|nr:50S ribosomal protein L6 [Candidatus Paceibacterota bacterium]PIR60517.1 MAG: 50S ribosomal protein L6 [Candidatus Pacebacteria bacterium CG10_big_fil_rev_8_21_14_0_10_44_54]